jgi:N-acetylmuramoyl-L-alanine amidase
MLSFKPPPADRSSLVTWRPMTARGAKVRWSIATAVIPVALIVLAATGGEAPPALPTTPIPDRPAAIPAVGAIGDIETVEIDGRNVTIAGWAIDLDNPDSNSVRITVDGQFVDEVSATGTRFDIDAAYRNGADHGFEATVTLSRGGHRLCLFTAPDDDYITCERVARGSHKGVVVTRKGTMVGLVAARGDEYDIITPCGNEATITGGTRVRTTQILIDPGHGGSETASVGPNGLGEKRLNLDVAKRTAAALRERGYSVELTRTTDIRLPIAVRAGLANALDPDIFLSLHHNGGALNRSPVPGTQVYYQHDDDDARRLGGILYEEMFAAASEFPVAWVGNALDGVSTRLNDEGGDFYGIHRRTPDVTSIITEFLWLSNGAEAALLARTEVRNAEAEAIAAGIDRWYRTENVGSGFLKPFVDTFDSGGGGFEGCVDPPL